MEGHIFIYGQITSYQDEDAPKYGAVNLKDINNQLTNNKEADTLIVHINSPGGDVYEGFAIHDVLRATGKTIITQAEGMVASIATVPFLAGDVRRITENSQLMIHNPFGIVGGNAEDLQKYADLLKKEENRIADFYAQRTGKNVDDIKSLMNAETFMTADEAITNGFATEKVAQLKAVAQIKLNMSVTKEELTAKIEEGNKGILSKIMAIFKKQGVIKDLVLQTADDQNLDFGEEVQEASQIAVGSTATVDGKPAEGEYTMPDGTIYVFAGGKVTEIKEPAAPEPPAEDEAAKALKDENEAVKAQLTETTTKLTEAQDALKAVRDELDAFKAEITSDIKGLKPEPPITEGAETNRKPFKSNK